MSTLFISYSTKDRPTAEIFYTKLIEMGYEPPFRDDHPDSGIPAGSEWERELYRKLRLCKALVVLVSRNWLDSKWCFAELAYAKAMGKASTSGETKYTRGSSIRTCFPIRGAPS